MIPTSAFDSTATRRRRPSRWATGILILLGLLGAARPAAAMLPANVLDALFRMGGGRASAADEALLFMHNDQINRARMSGYISDGNYQAAQRSFSDVNEGLARRAATENGADFKVQQSTSKKFMSGTDSDYIMEVKAKNPVGQVKKIQSRYNQLANEYLEKNLKRTGTPFKRRLNWHNKLDVDFMADPEFVTDRQFKEIAKLNNDAYTRLAAAEYERVSRMGGNIKITPEQFRDYGLEMRDFIEKKQAKLEMFRKNPSLMRNPHQRAEFHRLMAQEQKYITRIESANAKLRKQAGLKLPPYKATHGPFYETHINKQGKLVIRKRSPSIAVRGAKRGPAHMVAVSSGSAVAKNSLNRAVRELSESMAQAHALNPKKWATVADDIAEMTRHLPPAEKGHLIERLKRQRGGEFAGKVAARMRAGVKSPGKAALLKGVLKKALSRDSVANLRAMREALNKTSAQAIKALGRIGQGMELYNAAKNMTGFWTNLRKAMDPDITDAEADRYFGAAFSNAKGMAEAGTLYALFEAVPPAGAAYLVWTLAHDGTSYALNNTRLGMWVNRHVENYAEAFDTGRHLAGERLTKWMGGENLADRSESELRRLEQTYWKALKEGRIRLKKGVTTKDVAELLRAGRLMDARDLIEPTKRPTSGPNEAGAEVWRLAGAPKISLSKEVDNWKPGMTVRLTTENQAGPGMITYKKDYLVVDKKTGARRPNPSADRQIVGRLMIGNPPAFLIAGRPARLAVTASIKLRGAPGHITFYGGLEGTGVTITSDSKHKGMAYVRAGKTETVTVTYEISVKRSSSNTKTLSAYVPGCAKVTWTYHAAIGVSAEDAIEQLARQAGGRPKRPGSSGPPKPTVRPAARASSFTLARTLADLRRQLNRKVDNGESVTGLASGHGQWLATTAKTSRYGRQRLLHSAHFVDFVGDVDAWRKRGYSCSNIAYQNGAWAATLSERVDLGPQEVARARSPRAAAAKIKQMQDRGYEVTSATKGEGSDWGLVFSKDSKLGKQTTKWTTSSSELTEWIRLIRSQGRAITTITQSGGMWFAVASSNAGIGEQVVKTHATLDALKADVAKAAKMGMRVTDVTAAPTGWLTVVSGDR